MYKAEITFNKCSERESTSEKDCATLQAAVDYLQREATGHMAVAAYINNKRVDVINGIVLGADGNPLCTNPAWNDIFAPAHLRIPTNPATLLATGKLEA